MKAFVQGEHSMKWIPISQLSVVWAQAQRGWTESKSREIADTFDPDQFGTLAVTLPNGKGIYHVIDGQHRRNAIAMLWPEGDQKVLCEVLNTHDPARAAEIWIGRNKLRTRPQAVDLFRVGVVAGRVPETEVAAVLKHLGYTVDFSSEDGKIRAVSALLTIRKRYGIETLQDALECVQATWGMNHEAVAGMIVRGFALFLFEYAGVVDRKRLSSKLAKQYTPARLLGAVRTAREFRRANSDVVCAEIILDAYNHGLRSGRLGEESAA